jgi:hemolysin III
MAIETAMTNLHKQNQKKHPRHQIHMTLDLEGNLVFQEVMNCITHGCGVLLAFVGSFTLSTAVRGSSTRHVVSCAVYSTSLVVLYTSSTLYHSFFSMRNTKWVFEVLDKCAIYILIAGSYTPFLQIVLAHEPIWSIFLLGFLWILCLLGITVEFVMPTWQYKRQFSLAMYLGMGWSALVCLPGTS